MGKQFETLEPALRDFIAAQHVFFVATAPLAGDGHVNLSPKGLDTFRILDARSVAYLDFAGSGVETIAHLRENGRITILFCAFDGPPKILRLQGRGVAVLPGDPEFAALRAHFGEHSGVRSIIRVKLERIADSCGYAVPLFEYRGDRTQLEAWAQKKGPEAIASYQAQFNANSIDGLPGIDPPRR